MPVTVAKQSLALNVGNAARFDSSLATPVIDRFVRVLSLQTPLLVMQLGLPNATTLVVVTRTPSHFSHSARRSASVALVPIASTSITAGAGTVPLPVLVTVIVPPDGAWISVTLLVSPLSMNS